MVGADGVLRDHGFDGGTAVVLANWLHVRGADWRERVAGWVEGSGCDVWVAQREVQELLSRGDFRAAVRKVGEGTDLVTQAENADKQPVPAPSASATGTRDQSATDTKPSP